jgi:carbamoyltransferase
MNSKWRRCALVQGGASRLRELKDKQAAGMGGAYLGLNIQHDTSAALVVDGDLVAAVEQERFDGCRHSRAFPEQAIDFCLATAGISREQLSGVAVSFDYSRFLWNGAPFEHNTIAEDDLHILGRAKQVQQNAGLWRRAREQLEQHGYKDAYYVRHHLAHAAAAFFLSGFEAANVLVVDGRGECESTSLMYASDHSILEIETYPIEHSLGQLYSYVTHLCGLHSRSGQEGKTMGLAAYGRSRIDFSKVVKIVGQRYSIDRNAMRRLATLRTPAGATSGDASDNADARDLAWSVQNALERVFVALGERLHNETGERRFVVSGGVGLNCNANAVLLSQPFVEQLFVQPAANDAGTAVGAAMLLWTEASETPPTASRGAIYLGPSYGEQAIEAALLSLGESDAVRTNSPAVQAAELVASGFVVGWYQGAMEFGPRALGNRSILADPRNPRAPDMINSKVKFRERWRPFAPSVLAERVGEWFHPAVESPYMLLTLNVRPGKEEQVPAITHIDGSARVQTVCPKDNRLFHELISSFHERTGVPMVLNTSLNTKGQPIVCTPSDAIRCFRSCDLDALVLGNYVLRKDVVPEA